MRKSALNMAVATLLGACSSLAPPPPAARPEPVAARTEPPQVEARPKRAEPPQAALPKRPREIRIDNHSIAAFRESWALLRASLSPIELAALNDAVVRLAFVRYDNAENLPVNLRHSPIVPEMIRDRIDGLTYSEILALTP